MSYKRKLIEVSLPLEVINRESAREKSIRHGHPSTLHLWWARRPLVGARAVLFAQLVDDPSSRPEEFPTEDDQQRERARPPKKTTAAAELQSVKNGRYRARFGVDTAKPDAMGESVEQAIEEALRHIAAAEGAENVEIVLDIRAENSSGFGENVVRTVKENSRVLGFDVSEFEDVEW
ncbi:hypothetical protein ABIE38_002346 [Dietzia sp. 2505]